MSWLLVVMLVIGCGSQLISAAPFGDDDIKSTNLCKLWTCVENAEPVNETEFGTTKVMIALEGDKVEFVMDTFEDDDTSKWSEILRQKREQSQGASMSHEESAEEAVRVAGGGEGGGGDGDGGEGGEGHPQPPLTAGRHVHVHHDSGPDGGNSRGSDEEGADLHEPRPSSTAAPPPVDMGPARDDLAPPVARSKAAILTELGVASAVQAAANHGLYTSTAAPPQQPQQPSAHAPMQPEHLPQPLPEQPEQPELPPQPLAQQQSAADARRQAARERQESEEDEDNDEEEGEEEDEDESESPEDTNPGH